MGKKKFYVVWNGNNPGIYDSWDKCQQQIKGFANVLFKSFSTLSEAEAAYASSPYLYIGKKESKPTGLTLPSCVLRDALAVDAACSGNPGVMEYRGVYLESGQQIFHFGPLFGTNNIGEFLAIVHALALLKQKGSNMPIYSDSRNAILWVKNKTCKTKLECNEKSKGLFELIARAESWLHNNCYSNPIIKWETQQWGEIPADFGRK